jgi:hypothetical protein
MRGKRPSAAAWVVAGIVLAQLVGCGSCVKEDEAQPDPGTSTGRKPIDLRAADKRFSQFAVPDAAADAGADGSSD